MKQKHTDTPLIVKLLRVSIAVLVVLEIPWFIGVQSKIARELTKTTAKVVRIDHYPSHCPDNRNSVIQCDTSDILVPVYEYRDSSGVVYEQADRFTGEYKARNPLRFLFDKQIGDKVTAYYTNGIPTEVSFVAGPFAYVIWLVPIILAGFLALPLFIYLLVVRFHRGKKPKHTKQ